MTTYEPPISTSGEEINILEPSYLAPDIQGYAVVVGDEVWIPDIRCDKPGLGLVSQFIENLSPRCCFVNVISPKLEGMLRRRGWCKRSEVNDGEFVDVWRKP